jgi:BirA family biotin operon repressor/biotin-[acetyl-CoA-carboxylase] ligase
MSDDTRISLSTKSIARALQGCAVGPFGAQIHYAAQVGSTNDVARTLAEKGAPEGTLVIADEQTAGRGRMGRRWSAPPKTSLLMSLIFRPTLPPEEANRLVMACGLAAAEAIEIQTKLSVDAKWPNDLLVGGAKLAGILAESALLAGSDQLAYVIVGIGVNVNVRDDPGDNLIYPATSLLRELGRPVDRLALLAAMLERLNRWRDVLPSSELDAAWQARLVTLGQRIVAGEVTGVAERVDRAGALLVREDTGNLVRLSSGDVSLRLTGQPDST